MGLLSQLGSLLKGSDPAKVRSQSLTYIVEMTCAAGDMFRDIKRANPSVSNAEIFRHMFSVRYKDDVAKLNLAKSLTQKDGNPADFGLCGMLLACIWADIGNRPGDHVERVIRDALRYRRFSDEEMNGTD